MALLGKAVVQEAERRRGLRGQYSRRAESDVWCKYISLLYAQPSCVGTIVSSFLNNSDNLFGATSSVGMKVRICKLIPCLLVVWACAARSRAWRTPVLATPQGRLRGVRGPAGQRRYYGIPYATADRFQVPTFNTRDFCLYILIFSIKMKLLCYI